MSRDFRHVSPWVAAIRQRGTVRMIPAESCAALRIGPRLVIDVLTIYAEHANERGNSWPSRQTVAEELGCTVNEVQRARRILRELALTHATTDPDAHGRANPIHLDVPNWPAVAAVDNSPVGMGVGMGDGMGDGMGIPPPNRKGEQELSMAEVVVESTERAREPAMPGILFTPPPPCKKHPNGWRHDENCGACANLRKFDQQQRSAVFPSKKCAHGIPNGNRLTWDGVSIGGCVECEIPECPHGDDVRRCVECKATSTQHKTGAAVAALAKKMAM